MINKTIKTCLGLFFLISISCSNKTPAGVEINDYFSNLFMRTGNGFTGGDGTYSVLLPDGKTVWIFGDTFLGTVEPDGSRKKLDPMYIRNSFVVQDSNKLTTIHQRYNNQDQSTIIPPQVLESDFEITETMQWYWPGDGFIENNELKVFVSEFHQTGNGMWDFIWKGAALASFSLHDLKQVSIIEFDFPNDKEIHYGHAVLEDRDYIYIYGLGEGKAHIARAKKGHVNESWEFYTKSGWNSNASNSMAILNAEASEQFTVFKHKNIYVLITQLGGFSKEICSFTSDNPYSGWGNKQVLYSTPLPKEKHNLITYNAVAHPQFIKNNKILISYNTNSFELADHFVNADIYRPRFINVSLNLIHPDF